MLLVYSLTVCGSISMCTHLPPHHHLHHLLLSLLHLPWFRFCSVLLCSAFASFSAVVMNVKQHAGCSVSNNCAMNVPIPHTSLTASVTLYATSLIFNISFVVKVLLTFPPVKLSTNLPPDPLDTPLCSPDESLTLISIFLTNILY